MSSGRAQPVSARLGRSCCPSVAPGHQPGSALGPLVDGTGGGQAIRLRGVEREAGETPRRVDMFRGRGPANPRNVHFPGVFVGTEGLAKRGEAWASRGPVHARVRPGDLNRPSSTEA